MYVKTIFAPTAVAGCSRQLHAVTWNSGVGAMNTMGRGVGATVGAGISPAAIPFCSASETVADIALRFMMLLIDPRCVS